jgi:hypothetical protein
MTGSFRERRRFIGRFRRSVALEALVAKLQELPRNRVLPRFLGVIDQG